MFSIGITKFTTNLFKPQNTEQKFKPHTKFSNICHLGLFKPKFFSHEIKFTSRESLEMHFEKHKIAFKNFYKNPEEYFEGALEVIKYGIKIQYNYKNELRVGYVRFMGNVEKTGEAKFEFVGTNNLNKITTYHISAGNSFWKLLNGDAKNRIITPYEQVEPTKEINHSFKK